MNLWFGGIVLALGLILSCSALTTEECQALVKPKTTFTPMNGRWTVVLGFSDNDVIDAMLRSTQSQWVDFLPSPTGMSDQFVEAVGISPPSSCKHDSSVVHIIGNSGITRKRNFFHTFHSLPTCGDCLLYHVTATNSKDLMKNSNPSTEEDLKNYHILYLMTKRSTITDAELAHATQQAECLGLRREPAFRYNPTNSLCEKDDEEEDDDD